MDLTLHWFEPVNIDESTLQFNPVLYTGVHNLCMSTPHHDKLMGLKNEIDKIAPIQVWDDVKKITNTYEYIFLSLQKRMYRSVAGVIPLSRSYFKMIELWDKLALIPPTEGPLRSAHSAEGPGGFLEAIMERTKKNARMIAMTLRSTERTVPGWRKSQHFMSNNPTVHVTYGADGTGNLYSLENQISFRNTAIAHLGGKAHIYTADGGFDFSADFNSQENTVQRLLAAEILCGINILQSGGTMIIKVFDTKQAATLDLLWLISACFEKTAISKPNTSRPANSERYWVGVGFKESTITPTLHKILETLTNQDAPNGWDHIFNTRPYSEKWIHDMTCYQEEMEKRQYHNIQITLNLIKQPQKSVVQGLLYTNIKNSIEWCKEHNIKMNPQYVGLSEEQIVSVNLEEALAPFQASGARTNLQAQFRPLRTHHVSSSSPSQLPQVAPAWRSALPASILGPVSSQTTSDTPPPNMATVLESHDLEYSSREEH
jgi:23S rRNA U2552 (ribose-2'-O)-methylase RlmE/FtsJ